MILNNFDERFRKMPEKWKQEQGQHVFDSAQYSPLSLSSTLEITAFSGIVGGWKDDDDTMILILIFFWMI